MALERRAFDVMDCTTREEKDFYGPRLMPKMYSQTAKIAPVALVTPIFTVRRAKDGEQLPVINKVFFRKGRGFVRYKGATLTQSHLTVLLTLANVAAGGLIDGLRTFHPSELLRKMGWSENPGNIRRLRELLDQLKEGQVRLWPEGNDEDANALRVSFLNHFLPSKDKPWELALNRHLLPLLFGGNLTNVNLPTRASLREGLGTFLYGFICAESCRLPISYAELHAASGSKAKDLAQFAKDVRAQLDSFKAARIINGYTQHRGGVHVLKP
jgi:hypothetical protein